MAISPSMSNCMEACCNLSDLNRELLRSRTERPVLFNRRTPYQCTQEDIDCYTKKFVQKEICLADIGEATQEITSFLSPNTEPPPKVQQALKRLKNLRNLCYWGPDLIIKAAHDLDTALFGGKLRKRIAISWVNRDFLNPDLSLEGRRELVGRCSTSPCQGTCDVFLNKDAIFDWRDPRHQMFTTLIHEMVHAYIAIACGRHEPEPQDLARGWVGGHGWLFRWIINLAELRLEKFVGVWFCCYAFERTFRWSQPKLRSLPSLVAKLLGEDIRADPHRNDVRGRVKVRSTTAHGAIEPTTGSRDLGGKSSKAKETTKARSGDTRGARSLGSEESNSEDKEIVLSAKDFESSTCDMESQSTASQEAINRPGASVTKASGVQNVDSKGHPIESNGEDNAGSQPKAAEPESRATELEGQDSWIQTRTNEGIEGGFGENVNDHLTEYLDLLRVEQAVKDAEGCAAL